MKRWQFIDAKRSKIMRIGILTFHRADNYGAVLQAFALQEYLRLNGHKVEIIDYRAEAISNVYKLLPKKNFSKNILKSFISLPFRFIRAKLFENFRLKMLFISENSFSEKKTEFLDYDAIFFGSDQIWNPKITKGFDKVFWGDLKVKGKPLKIAYAASAGDDLNVLKSNESLKTLLDNFDMISLRESYLTDFLSGIADKTPETVLDPTFLLSEKRWEEIACAKNKKKYLLLYQMNFNRKARILAEKIAKKRNLKIVEIWNGFNLARSLKSKLFVSPQKFIDLFKNADFVVTTSFHGTAFSIIYRKNFYYIWNGCFINGYRWS